ncbi:MAG: hypothetical protein AB7S87_12865 [Burkholderiales bacterium]
MLTAHHTKLTPSAWSATTSQAGYGPENLATESLGRPFRAADAGATDVTIEFPAPIAFATLFLHDVNFSAAAIETSPDAIAFAPAGNLATYANEAGRRRGSVLLNAVGVQALKVRIAAGVPTDGLAYWRGGAAYVMQTAAALPVGPRIGYAVRTRRALLSVDLPNNQVAQATIGPDADVIELSFERKFGQSLQALIERAKAGTVILAHDLTDWPEQQWPVRYLERDGTETYFRVHKAQRQLTLRETV